MDIKEGWFMTLILGVAFFCAAFSWAMTRVSIASDCKISGSFIVEGKVYDCKPREVKPQ